ncbi:MAG: flagellar hook basal-body protein [Melioribacter sp.]|uniref:flagellar hook-basal body protein n=1 Tax=Rosettibacter primus TaxID=3111523 RepID=UPI00247E8F12|nr:flagellar hook basal-body protein [Melioribacter sp.]
MIKGIYTVARSMDQRAKNIDIISNNLANINTTAFKREIPFAEYINEAGESQIRKLTSQQQGELVLTSNPLDLAINGNGFFAVKSEDGTIELTRNGRFQISDEGYLIDAKGRKVLGKNGGIFLEDTLRQKNSQILVSTAGEIKIDEHYIDTLLIVKVDEPEQLTRSGESNFLITDENYTEANQDEYKISQGYLEESNANPILEMEAMIQLNKAYERAQKIINALDQSLDHANQIGKI